MSLTAEINARKILNNFARCNQPNDIDKKIVEDWCDVDDVRKNIKNEWIKRYHKFPYTVLLEIANSEIVEFNMRCPLQLTLENVMDVIKMKDE